MWAGNQTGNVRKGHLGQTATPSLRWSSLLLGEGNGTPLQYSRLENLMDGGTWWATVHGVPVYRVWGFKESDVTKRIRHTILKIFRKYNQ